MQLELARILCGAGALGWTRLPAGFAHRRWWMASGAIVAVGLIAAAPGQYRAADRELGKLARQQHIEGDLVALVKDGAISLRCGKVGVSNHAPIPLLALYLKTSPRNVVSPEAGRLRRGTFLAASPEATVDYVLAHYPVDPKRLVSPFAAIIESPSRTPCACTGNHARGAADQPESG